MKIKLDLKKNQLSSKKKRDKISSNSKTNRKSIKWHDI